MASLPRQQPDLLEEIRALQARVSKLESGSGIGQFAPAADATHFDHLVFDSTHSGTSYSSSQEPTEPSVDVFVNTKMSVLVCMTPITIYNLENLLLQLKITDPAGAVTYGRYLSLQSGDQAFLADIEYSGSATHLLVLENLVSGQYNIKLKIQFDSTGPDGRVFDFADGYISIIAFPG